MDDVIILFKHERAYRGGKKQIFEGLRDLRLKISPHKTRMESLEQGHVPETVWVESKGEMG